MGGIKTVEELGTSSSSLYFDSARRLLYINSSENSGVFQELAEAVVGDSVTRLRFDCLRVMGDIQLTPTNVGVLDIHINSGASPCTLGPT